MDYMNGAGRFDRLIACCALFIVLLPINWPAFQRERLLMDNVIVSAPVVSREAWLCEGGRNCRDTVRFEGAVGSPEWGAFVKRCPCSFYVNFSMNSWGGYWPVKETVDQKDFEATLPGVDVRVYLDRHDVMESHMAVAVDARAFPVDPRWVAVLIYGMIALVVLLIRWEVRKKRRREADIYTHGN